MKKTVAVGLVMGVAFFAAVFVSFSAVAQDKPIIKNAIKSIVKVSITTGRVIIPVSTCSLAVWDRTPPGWKETPTSGAHYDGFMYIVQRNCLIDVPDGAVLKRFDISSRGIETDDPEHSEFDVQFFEEKFTGESRFLCQTGKSFENDRCNNLNATKTRNNAFRVVVADKVLKPKNNDAWKYSISQVKAIQVEYEPAANQE